MRYAIIDVETTGGRPKESKITEIAIYIHDGEKVVDELSTLVNPEMPIPDFIVRLTGISDEMVANAPKFFEIAKRVVEITTDCVFVAHNVGFDYSMIRGEYRSLGFDYRRDQLCTVRSSRYLLPGHESYSLGKLCRALGIHAKNRHRASGDALATVQLFEMLLERTSGNMSGFIQTEIVAGDLNPNIDFAIVQKNPNKSWNFNYLSINSMDKVRNNYIIKELQQWFKQSELKAELIATVWHPKNYEKFKYF
jgi:DNA polymerase-3 subunit epsilon